MHAAPRGEGVLPGARPVPGAARRHRPQLPRGARVPRPPRRASSASGWSSPRVAGVDRRTAACVEETGPRASRNRLQTVTLLDAIEEHGFDAAFGGAPPRRGEGPRQGARLLASATSSASGTRRTSGPSCGASTTARIRKGEHIRVFPLSQLDRARHLAVHRRARSIELPSIYFAHRARGRSSATACCCAVEPTSTPLRRRARPSRTTVRFRTVGDMTLHRRRRVRRPTTVDEVIAEIAAARITERGATRADDRFSEAAMEDRKKEGYF